MARTFTLPPATATMRRPFNWLPRKRQDSFRQRRFHRTALIVEEVGEQLADAAIALDLVDFGMLDHAGGDQRSFPLGRAYADEHQVGPACQIEDIADAALAEQHLTVLGRVGDERHRHHIGLRAGPLGQTMDDVVRVGREFARHAAKQRDETDMGGCGARQIFDACRKGAAMADTDKHIFAAIDLALQKLRAGDAKRPERQIVLIEIGTTSQ